MLLKLRHGGARDVRPSDLEEDRSGRQPAIAHFLTVGDAGHQPGIAGHRLRREMRNAMDREPGQEYAQLMQLALPVVFVQRVEQLRFGTDAPGGECGAAKDREILICVFICVAVDVF
ncbi:hypothetical protein ACF09Y_33875 [Streptomyces massasporeus]|uniref:hypothetical protein n=1 Tax=Streptomyces massasporeus TaxID=67324 RepID=UPI0036FD9EC8